MPRPQAPGVAHESGLVGVPGEARLLRRQGRPDLEALPGAVGEPHPAGEPGGGQLAQGPARGALVLVARQDDAVPWLGEQPPGVLDDRPAGEHAGGGDDDGGDGPRALGGLLPAMGPGDLAEALGEAEVGVVGIDRVDLADHAVEVDGQRRGEVALDLGGGDELEQLLGAAEGEGGQDHRALPRLGRLADEGHEVGAHPVHGLVPPVAVGGLEDEQVDLAEVLGPGGGGRGELGEGGEVAGEEHPAAAPVLDEDARGAEDVARGEEADRDVVEGQTHLLLEPAGVHLEGDSVHLFLAVGVPGPFLVGAVLRVVPLQAHLVEVVLPAVLQLHRKERRGGARAVDVEVVAEPAHQGRDPADVVGVRVGEQEGVDAVETAEAGVQVPGGARLDPAVDQDSAATKLEEVAAAADLRGAPEGVEPQGRLRPRHGDRAHRPVAGMSGEESLLQAEVGGPLLIRARPSGAGPAEIRLDALLLPAQEPPHRIGPPRTAGGLLLQALQARVLVGQPGGEPAALLLLAADLLLQAPPVAEQVGVHPLGLGRLELVVLDGGMVAAQAVLQAPDLRRRGLRPLAGLSVIAPDLLEGQLAAPQGRLEPPGLVGGSLQLSAQLAALGLQFLHRLPVRTGPPGGAGAGGGGAHGDRHEAAEQLLGLGGLESRRPEDGGQIEDAFRVLQELPEPAALKQIALGDQAGQLVVLVEDRRADGDHQIVVGPLPEDLVHQAGGAPDRLPAHVPVGPQGRRQVVTVEVGADLAVVLEELHRRLDGQGEDALGDRRRTEGPVRHVLSVEGPQEGEGGGQVRRRGGLRVLGVVGHRSSAGARARRRRRAERLT